MKNDTLRKLLIGLVILSAALSLWLNANASSLPTHCTVLKYRDDIVNCYFKKQNWKKVTAYKDYQVQRNYATDAETNAAEVVYFYEVAIAYKHLGDHSQEKTYISLTAQFPSNAKFVSKWYWAQVMAEYKSSGSIVQVAQQNHSIHAFIAKYESGLSRDQRKVYEANIPDDPCHKNIFDGGSNYHQVTWWYCDSNGNYIKAYTFLNGRLTSIYTP